MNADISSRVAFRACRSYDARLPAALDELLADLGGWERFVRRGTRVLVKPNLLADEPPEKAVTTHPALLSAVVGRLRAAGADVIVGDSPASAVRIADVWERTGTAAVCAALDVPLVSFEKRGAREVVRDGFVFGIAGDALDAELIVSLPKVKTHNLTLLTAGVKNLFGTLPGYQKTQRHKEFPHPAAFGRYLRALVKALPPVLSIADGVVGMHGDGPSGGDPVALGFLAAASDPAMLDLALCRALRIPPRRVPSLAEDLAAGRDRRLELAGTPLAALELPPFKLPPASPARFVPQWLARAVSPLVWVRPRFDGRCIRCGRCVAACPMRALSPATTPGVSGTPVLDGARCVGCCCCQEVCPARAIRMRQSPLLRLARPLQGL